jgi:3-phytase (myo-inositol-hexaphosphate 3-phosphohydrolase)
MKIIIYFLLLISFTSSAAIEDHKIYPIYETEAVKTSGDAADDSAFWLNKSDPEKSIVLGTDKKSKIYTYDLSGKTLDNKPMGRINNINLRNDYINSK